MEKRRLRGGVCVVIGYATEYLIIVFYVFILKREKEVISLREKEVTKFSMTCKITIQKYLYCLYHIFKNVYVRNKTK